MKQDEAEKLAREIKRRSDISYKGADVEELCNHILSGDMKREIENAAFERAAKLIDRQEKTARKGTDSGAAHRELAYRVTAASIRALIQPPAQQKENGG